jgi:hypothetical protein
MLPVRDAIDELRYVAMHTCRRSLAAARRQRH